MLEKVRLHRHVRVVLPQALLDSKRRFSLISARLK